MRSIWIGYDDRETEAFAVARRSMRRAAPSVPIQALCLDDLREAGLYRRPTSQKDGKLWDDISDAPMSTQFAISRFLAPVLAGTGWALFTDCDVLALDDINKIFDECDPTKAVMCVQHPNYVPANETKMDGQLQTMYHRKNWSSVCVWNCDHPANKALTVDYINTVPGRELHAFSWLKDDEIGALDPGWNFLVGVSDPAIKPRMCHWTNGGPWFPAYRDVPYAAEWMQERSGWLTEGVQLMRWLEVKEDPEPELPFHDRWVRKVHAITGAITP